MILYSTDSVSVQGYSHILAEKECQDASRSWKREKYCAAIVCDGHGGEKYIRSARGSKFACEIGQELIDNFMRNLTSNPKLLQANHDREEAFTRLERSIVLRWRERVSADLAKTPVTDDPRFSVLTKSDQESLLASPVKAYGSTFIAAVVTSAYSFVLQLGDGNACFVPKNGSAFLPDELEDSELQFNVTTSLCNSNADVAFRCFYYPAEKQKPLKAVILTSDGVINCYPSVEKYLSFITNVASAYEEDPLKKAHADLQDVLHVLSERGSGDDLSLAIIHS